MYEAAQPFEDTIHYDRDRTEARQNSSAPERLDRHASSPSALGWIAAVLRKLEDPWG